MDILETAQVLIKFGAILGIVLGLFSTLFWLSIIIARIGLPIFTLNIFDILMFVLSVLAMISDYIIFTHLTQWIDTNPFNYALVIIGLGVIIALGGWGVAGVLIIIGGILIIIDETSYTLPRTERPTKG